MKGILGHSAWRWYATVVFTKNYASNLDRLFYIEGTLTIFTALITAFVLPGFPSGPRRWLSPIEVRLARERPEEDALIVNIRLKSRAKGKSSLAHSGLEG